MTKKFYYITPFKRIAVCKKPSMKCDHEHYYFLSLAARKLAEDYNREYHITFESTIERCAEPHKCHLDEHFLTRHEVVKRHRETYDFSGEWRPLENPYVSLLEREFADFLELLGFKSLRNSNTVIFPHELDLYFPERGVAFEFNGDFWHSEEEIQSRYQMSSYDYHRRKAGLCEEKDILLGFVWESNWRHDWKTVIDNACDFLQFRRRTAPLLQYSSPLSPAEFYWEKVDRDGVFKHRQKLDKRVKKAARVR